MKYNLLSIIFLIYFSYSFSLSPITENNNNSSLFNFIELENNHMASSLFSSINLQLQSGDEIDSIFNFIMNLREKLLISKKENFELIKTSQRDFNFSVIKYEETIRFHLEKEDYYSNLIKRFNQENNDDTIILTKEKYQEDLIFYENIKDNLLLRMNTNFRNLIIEIEDYENVLKHIENLNKNILKMNNENIISYQNTTTDNYLFQFVNIISNIKINLKNKEKTVTLLYNIKSKLEKNKNEKIEKTQKLEKNIKALNEYLTILIEQEKIYYNINFDKNSKEKEEILRIENNLNFHKECLKSNQNEITKLKKWWENESDNFQNIQESLINSTKALSQVKKILLNNFEEFKDYLNNSR